MLGPGIYKNFHSIGKNEDKQLIKSSHSIPKKYYSGITNSNKKTKQIKSIRGTKKSHKSNIMRFNEAYNIPITNKHAVETKTGVSVKAQERILKKGKGSYYSAGSKPKQSSSNWAYGRLASVIMGGKAKKYDQHILDEENITIKNPSKKYVKGKKNTKKRNRKLKGVKSAKSIKCK